MWNIADWRMSMGITLSPFLNDDEDDEDVEEAFGSCCCCKCALLLFAEDSRIEFIDLKNRDRLKLELECE